VKWFVNTLAGLYNEFKNEPNKIKLIGLLIMIGALFTLIVTMALFMIALIPCAFYGIYISYLWAVEGVKPNFFGFFCMFMMVSMALKSSITITHKGR
jgi:uncharacterized membrane protein